MAQDSRFEFTPLVSFTTSATIDQKAVGVDALTFDRAVTWGGQIGYLLSPHVELEVLATKQSTAISMKSTLSANTTFGSAVVLDTTVHQFHGNLLYEFGAASRTFRPFAFGGIGATMFTADTLPNDARFSWTAGAGVKWLALKYMGLRLHARYKPTQLHSGSSSTCAPFDFCQGSLHHVEISAGAIIRY
jgi:outer membrane protein W